MGVVDMVAGELVARRGRADAPCAVHSWFVRCSGIGGRGSSQCTEAADARTRPVCTFRGGSSGVIVGSENVVLVGPGCLDSRHW